MKTLLFALVLLVTVALPKGRTAEKQLSWQEVRDQQPPGVRLTMTLPKTRYHLGEVITATLKFSNDTEEIYHLSGPSGGRAGRVSDVAFRAQAEDGSFVGDPLEWYMANRLRMGGGGGTQKMLGDWEFSLAANQWLQLQKPGIYRLYAWSSCLTPGTREAPYKKQVPPVQLVSDPITVTIEPLTPEEEKKIIDEAVGVLDAPPQGGRFDPAFDAMERLRFLQTPAATDVLLQYADARYGDQARMALVGRPNYAASAEHILASVREGRLGLNDGLLYLYEDLSQGSFLELFQEARQRAQAVPASPRPTPAEDKKEHYPKFGDLPPPSPANEKLFAAAREAVERGERNEAYFADLLTLYRRDAHEPTIRALLIQHQLELPAKLIDFVFGDDYWRSNESELLVEKDFLPLIREQARPERHSVKALAALAKVAPDEARPIIVEDIRLNRPVYRVRPNVVRTNPDLHALIALPDRELPELDSALRERLQMNPDDQPGLESTMLLVDRYATKALLPDVIRLYQANEGHWQCVLQAAALRYWIRCDRAAGLEALRRALEKDGPGETGCYRVVLTDVLEKNWVDEALPLVLAATTHRQPETVESAVRLLKVHAGPEAAESVVAAVERFAAQHPSGATYEERQILGAPSRLTRSLLEQKQWTLNRAQLERLLWVCAEPALQKQLKEKITEIGQP